MQYNKQQEKHSLQQQSMN